MSAEETKWKALSRRGLLTGSAAGAVVAGTGMGGALLSSLAPSKAMAQGGGHYNLEPGELDAYYGFWSSGQTGELRIMGGPQCVDDSSCHSIAGNKDRIRCFAARHKPAGRIGSLFEIVITHFLLPALNLCFIECGQKPTLSVSVS